jgi:AAA+ ATPase superfamily predicted ATPase
MVIGRDKEIVELNRLYSSHQAQFVAIYGRRQSREDFSC